MQEWDAEAQALWLRGERQHAIDAVLGVLNRHGEEKPVKLVLQLAYYIFLCGDPRAAAGFLEAVRPRHPKDPDLLLNLAVCLSRGAQFEEALLRVQEYLELRPDDVVAYDCLCSTLHRLHRNAEAAEAGTRALELKDRAAAPAPAGWKLPAASPGDWVGRPGKRNVIAFSLWGAHPRYLHGALHNAVVAPDVYPGWTLVYFVDDTVPMDWRARLVELGAEVRAEPAGQPIRQRLAWRFKVANDPQVGRFLVRDVDSVINHRERAAVQEWIDSDRWFHAMRDWWTHTDLLLAGMWGGVAGVLPDLGKMLSTYQPGAMETPNVDQWFLRDAVWPYVRESCLVHDRCFSPGGAQRWPVPAPEGTFHVGQNEYAVRRMEQERRLSAWLPRG